MRVHGGFVVALVVVTIGATAYLSITGIQQRADRRDLRSATALAHAISAPAGAVSSHECHGDGLVSCWTSPQDPAIAARELATAMRTRGADPQVQCHRVTVGRPSAAPLSLQDCSVMVRFGSRVTAGFVNSHGQLGNGRPAPAGSLISLSAS